MGTLGDHASLCSFSQGRTSYAAMLCSLNTRRAACSSPSLPYTHRKLVYFVSAGGTCCAHTEHNVAGVNESIFRLTKASSLYETL